MKRKSPTSAWARSLSSTRRPPGNSAASNMPAAAAAAAEAAAAEAAAAEAAAAVAAAEAAVAAAAAAGAAAAAAAAAVCRGDVASSRARLERCPITLTDAVMAGFDQVGPGQPCVACGAAHTDAWVTGAFTRAFDALLPAHDGRVGGQSHRETPARDARRRRSRNPENACPAIIATRSGRDRPEARVLTS
jgi:hypothetical protein